MSRRLLWSLRAFHLSLAALLLAGVLSAIAWRYDRAYLAALCNGAIVVAASVAGMARCWQWWVQRTMRRADFSVGPGHYGMDPFGDHSFLA